MIDFIDKHTFRFLRKNGTFTLLNVLGLAFGFACAIFIILHVRKEYSYNSQIPDSERIFNIAEKSPESPLGNTTICYALTPLLKNNFPEIEYAARTENFSNFGNCIVSYQSADSKTYRSFNEYAFYLADKDIFQILNYPFIEGSREIALKELSSIVISKKTAEKYFGNKPALGEILVLNNQKSFKITGVVDLPEYVTFKFSMIVPMNSIRSESYLSGWDSNGEPYFKLRKNVDYKNFNKKIEHFYSVIRPEQIRTPDQLRLSLIPITERRLYYNKNPLYLLIFIGFVVLSVSILNYVNMSTSFMQKRTSEIALKKISGASKETIGYQFFKETGFICFISILTGILVIFAGMPLFTKLTGSDILPFFKDHLQLFFYSCIVLWFVVTVIASIYPAIILSGIKTLTLFGKNRKSFSGIKSKNVIISFQFVISILLIIITLMIGRQYKYMSQMPLGFNNKMVIQVPFNDILKDKYSSLRDELTKIPGVKNVCSASSMPAGIPNHSGVEWVDLNGQKQGDSFGFAIASDGYTQTFEMKMLIGNEFIHNKPEELKGVIINETAAKRMGYNNPIGKRLYFWGRENIIIGVVKDFQNNFMFNTIKPMIISAHPSNQHFTKFLYISILPGNSIRTLSIIEKTIKKVSPLFPFEYSFTNKEVESYIDEIKQLNNTFQFASIVSIVLAMIGLLALTYHATQARIKEIGIRKVNGAKSFEIIQLLNTSNIVCVLIAFVIASPIAWLIMNKLLMGIGNRASISWWTFISAGSIVGIAALITVSIQSYMAATRNPVEALRYE